MKHYLVDIIIVNWNGGEKILNCVIPLLNSAHQNTQLNIIVSDNGSTDGSVASLSALGVKVIANNANIGFGAACNRALPYCTGEYILLLNPDAVASVDAIAALAKRLSEDPLMASIGPKQVDKDGKVQRSCGRFPTFFTSVWELTGLSKLLPGIFTPAPIMLDWAHDSSRKVDHVMGSCMLLKRQVTESVGFMDEGFFVYLEDLDLSKRMHDAGFYSYYENSVSIYHEGGGISKQVMENRLFYSLHSKFYYWKKHFNKTAFFVLSFLGLTIEPFIRTAVLVLSGKLKAAKITARVYRLLYRRLLFKTSAL